MSKDFSGRFLLLSGVLLWTNIDLLFIAMIVGGVLSLSNDDGGLRCQQKVIFYIIIMPLHLLMFWGKRKFLRI